MNRGKGIIEKIVALPAMTESQVQYRGYTIRWTGWNQYPRKGYPRGTRVGQCVARIEDKQGRVICDIACYAQASLRPRAEESERKHQVALKILTVIDELLAAPQDRRDNWHHKGIYCQVDGHDHERGWKQKGK